MRKGLLPTTGYIFIHCTFLLYSVICLIPILLVVAVSFTDERTVILNGYSLFPEKFSISAYKFVLGDSPAILRAYGVTVFVTIIGSILSLIIIALYAYPISRQKFRYNKLFTFLALFTMLFSGGMVPWYLVCAKVLHLKDSIWGLIVPYLMNAWYVLIMRTFYKTNVPESILEAATIDGAGEFKTFIRIVLPLSLPAMATIGLFNTLAYWNDWWLPLMLINDTKLINLQYLIYKIQTNISFLSMVAGSTARTSATVPNETSRMAMCVIAIGPIILAYPFFQKYFVKGLTIGAVKG